MIEFLAEKGNDLEEVKTYLEKSEKARGVFASRIKDVKMKFQKEKEDHSKEVMAHKDILVEVKNEQHASVNDIIHAAHVTFQISLNYVELLCPSLKISL